ncbi:uncharacterized protein [Scyliorhinus torazame]|uniref:uncharacterized protein n=1 Tax=Scyliorhinus torazame TaxID=75743 RepID=UPI003B5CEE2D
MLRIFLTVSVLFWNQLAARDPAEEVLNFCQDEDCLKPVEAILGRSYDELEFDFRQLVVTDSIGSNVRLVVDDGLFKIANYSLGENAAGTVVPVSAPWGADGYLENGTIQQRFKVFLPIVPQVINPPEPTNPTVKIVTEPPIVYFVRGFDEVVDDEQIKVRVIQFLNDLEEDNQPFNRARFVLAVFSTNGLMEIGFEKTEE